jgi:hypothetical protein
MNPSRREFLATVGSSLAIAPFVQNPQAPQNVHVVQGGSTGSLLAPSDLTYKGIIRLPFNGVFSNGAGALAFRRVGGAPHLFTCCGPGYGGPGEGVWELALPDPGSNWTNIPAAPQATIVTGWDDIYHGKRLLGSPVQPRTMGLWWDEANQRLFWTYKDGYSTGWWNPSIGCSTLNNPATAASTAYGPWRTAQFSQLTHGYMASIPDAFAAANCPGMKMAVGAPPNSGDAATGGALLFASALPANGTPADAPALTMSNPHITINQKELIHFDNVNRQPRPATAGPTKVCEWTYGDLDPAHAVLYPITQDFGPKASNQPNVAFNLDMLSACAWIDTPTKSGLIYFGQICDTILGYDYGLDPGVCHTWYEDVATCPHGQHSATWSSTGPGAATMVPYLCIFDPKDLAKVAQGSLGGAAIRPTSFVKCATIMPIDPQCWGALNFGGAAFDSASSLLYVSQTIEDLTNPNVPQPIIHVFHVN